MAANNIQAKTSQKTKETNQQALDLLLNDIEKASGTITRDKGTRFETLIKDWLTKEPTYKDLFTEVLTYKEWNDRYHKESSRDIGIDLVGVNASGDGFTAIQCKFYGKEETVPKAGVDSFIAASNKPYFTARFLVATNAKWSSNVALELKNIIPPVTLITRETLAQSVVDWNAYRKGKLKLVDKRTPRPYQLEAIKKVIDGFKEADRGKLIMACGTGKTYTSLKIAEQQAGKGKLVLFLVPSLSLLSQTLSDWKQQCIYPINAFAVCSDSKIGKSDVNDLDSLTVGSELSYPATTDKESLRKEVKRALNNKEAMTVIFSTYQSIEVIHEAQQIKGKSFGEFDLVICDEAHRTAGGYRTDDQSKKGESYFTRIHDNKYVAAKKRLYMTATPRIYGEIPKKQEEEGEVVLYSMDDESIFGKEFHSINFSEAVRLGSLVDYKVIVLTVDESIVGNKYDAVDLKRAASGGLSVANAAKIVGCWRALSKRDLQGEVSIGDDLSPMRRAVGFAQVINPSDKYDRVSSKLFTAQFQNTIERFKDKLRSDTKYLKKDFFEQQNSLVCDTRHIDGSMDATQKAELLNWLREEPEENHCKILFNVRCLSEGVDVPALDAVLFLSPRDSQVDVVQTVGRVMRISPTSNKKRGYVIIPIVTPAGLPADAVLDNNDDFRTVWQVLRALKSIDEDFGMMVDGQLKKINPDRMEVICLTNNKFTRKSQGKKPPVEKRRVRNRTSPAGKNTPEFDEKSQQELIFGTDPILEEEIRARIIKKVGNRKEWSDWAEDVGMICKKQIEDIKIVLNKPNNKTVRKKFDEFSKELNGTLNGNLSEDEVLEMLGQHIVTKPVMDALFSDFPFTEKNPVAKALTTMLSVLDKEGMKSATELLESFYKSVKQRAQTITTAKERQTVVLELFDKFFKLAFPKIRDKLGIVYTPVEVVDFINHSVADVLKREFKTDIAGRDVHILDPFTGTGTFLTRLMQTGLIPKDKLEKKFKTDIHANEIVPLAYYVASMNLESTLHELLPDKEYEPNQVMVWTDTFADHDSKTLFSTSLSENNARLRRENDLDIRVIVANPPYSVGQETQNENNQNEHYDKLDKRIEETYASRTDATLKSKLYDSYIRAYRWASDRIGDKGVIGFITNAGWIESNSADGMRKCMADEFNSIYIFHLKGNARTQGERRRKEKDNIFGEGSRAPVAIVILVKNPDAKEMGRIYYHEVDDYLTREQKLEQIAEYKSISNIPWRLITPDKHGDWLNQRDDSFNNFMRMDGKKTEEKALFRNFSLGVVTSRDPWAYNSSSNKLEENIKKFIRFYNEQVDHLQSIQSTLKPAELKQFSPKDYVSYDSENIAWTHNVLNLAKKGTKLKLLKKLFYVGLYRPFFKQNVYFSRRLNERVYQLPKLFPTSSAENIAICVTGIGAKEFSCLMTNRLPDYQLEFNSQCFPRYLYSEENKATPAGKQPELTGLEDESSQKKAGNKGYQREDAITNEGLKHFQEAYPRSPITKDDLFYYIYGILHSKDYKAMYANNLGKELPRIPRVATYKQFKAFEEAGRKLADLHINYETKPRYKGVKITKKPGSTYKVTQMRWGKIPGETGNAAKDKTVLHYNDGIKIENIPLKAQEYVVNKKSALDWIVERCCVSVDKASGIVNDFNLYGEEQGDSHYPYDLFLRMITVSLETVDIVDHLPPLEIHPLDKD